MKPTPLSAMDARLAAMYAEKPCVTYDTTRVLGDINSGFPPGVYVMWVRGYTKVGRSTDAYTRYLFYLGITRPLTESAEDVFMIGFLAALPGESLNELEKQQY